MEKTIEIFTTTHAPQWYSNVSFSWYDYGLFSSMLIISILIGIYFGCFGSKQSTANEYLMGGKKMLVFPISMSLIASHVSGITLLAVPADVYRFGIAYWLSCFAIIGVCALTSYVYLPVFYDLQLTSTYEYLHLRFDKRVRTYASVLYTLSVLLYLPIVIYIPALAFSQATGVNIYYITPVVCGICIFYTTIGGLKAVVWTDTLQFTVTVGATAVVFYIGLYTTGGIQKVFSKAQEGRRLEIDFDWDPTKRDTFWAVLIGWTITWISHISINQGCIQKFLSLPTIQDANKSIALFAAGLCIIKTICVITGLIMYSKYSDCDPFTTGRVKQPDQLFPYFVMDVVGHIPGLPGLFIAGVFCTALSTLSATLNCIAGTIYEDFISQFMPKTITPKKVSNILKLIVAVIGVICTSLVFIIAQLGELLPLAISFFNVTSGTLLGLFTLGMVFPKVHSKGAFYGSFVSLICVMCILVGSKWYQIQGLLKYTPKPVSTNSCDYDFIPKHNSTILEKPTEIFYLFRITYYYYSLIGAAITAAIAIPVSKYTSSSDAPVSKKLITPMAHFMLHDKPSLPAYYSIDKALHVIISKDQ